LYILLLHNVIKQQNFTVFFSPNNGIFIKIKTRFCAFDHMRSNQLMSYANAFCFYNQPKINFALFVYLTSCTRMFVKSVGSETFRYSRFLDVYVMSIIEHWCKIRESFVKTRNSYYTLIAKYVFSSGFSIKLSIIIVQNYRLYIYIIRERMVLLKPRFAFNIIIH